MQGFAHDLHRANTATFAALADAAATIGGHTLPALFDAAYAHGDLGGIGMASYAPAITIPSPRVPLHDLAGQTVHLRWSDGGQDCEQTFAIAEARPDGAGGALLLLEELP